MTPFLTGTKSVREFLLNCIQITRVEIRYTTASGLHFSVFLQETKGKNRRNSEQFGREFRFELNAVSKFIYLQLIQRGVKRYDTAR